jgi:hypothetical protein
MGNFDGTRASDALALQQLISEYCYELDLTGGLDAYRFFTSDGFLDVGKMTINGHDAMKAFYRDIVEQAKAADPSGVRTTRHVFTNLRVDFEDTDRATVDFIVMNFSSAGAPPVFDATTPTVVSDARCKCRRESDGAWRIAEFTGAPIFVGNDPLQNKALVE